MQELKTLRYTEEGQVARVELLRDTINMRMVRELTAVCDHLEDESEATIVVFTGAGDDFCRGIDFRDFRPDQPVDIHGFNKWEKACVRIERLPKVTVAAMQGEVRGGGLQLALVCDVRIASPDAVFQLPEVKSGFLPGMATFRLAKYVGLGRAKRLIMQCPEFDAHKAVALGLIDEVAYDLDEGVQAAIDNFLPVHPVVVQLARRLLNESYATDFENAIGNFLAAQHRAVTQTAFLETLKRARQEDGGGD